MKKLVAFLLAVCSFAACASVFAACDGEQTKVPESPVSGGSTTETPENQEPTVSGGITEEKWNEAIQADNFNNVTFSFSGKFISGPQGSQDDFSCVCKIDGDSATMDGELMESEFVPSLKNVYINTANAIVKDFGDFTYDEASKTYKSKQDIVYTVNVMNTDTTITAQNVCVTLDDANKIASIACMMKQNFTQDDKQQEFTMNITFTYSGYGTTVLG